MDEVRERGPLRAKDFFRVLNYNLQLTDNRNERFVSIVDSVRGSMYTMRTRGRRKNGPPVNGESNQLRRSPDGSFDFADHDFSNRPTWQRFRAAVARERREIPPSVNAPVESKFLLPVINFKLSIQIIRFFNFHVSRATMTFSNFLE